MHTWTFTVKQIQSLLALLCITMSSSGKFLCICMRVFQPSPWRGQGSALPIFFDLWLFAV